MTAVLASVLTGLFTLAAALGALFLQGRQQRAAAQEERLWSRLAETYVALLQFHGSGMIEGYGGAASAQEWAVRDELTAKATAFASDKVLELWQRSALAYGAWESYVDEDWPQWTTAGSVERLGLEEEMEKDPEYRRFRQARDEAGKQLAEQIRVELDARRQRGPRRRRQEALIRDPAFPDQPAR
jgi:hypothetical protein